MKRKRQILEAIYILLIILWSYAAVTKLSNMEKSRMEMLNQIFPNWMAEILTWLVPVIELILALLLLFKKTRRRALVGSLLLLIAFTGYVGLVMTGMFGRVPCSCGGILAGMGHAAHLVFNLFYTGIAAVGLYLQREAFSCFKNFSQKRKEAL